MSAEKKDSVLRDILVLTAITLVAGLLLGLSYSVTKQPIKKAHEAQRQESQKQVFPDAACFTPAGNKQTAAFAQLLQQKGITATSVTAADQALDASGNLIGCVITAVNSEGYGGDVELMAGIGFGPGSELTLHGISFLTLTETAGMGMRAKEKDFLEQFREKTLPDGAQITYTKTGAKGSDEIDAISGCTVTTAAVTKDVNAALAAAAVMKEG